MRKYYDIPHRMKQRTQQAARTTISMPSQILSRAQRERVRGRFSTFSAYVHSLIRKDVEEAREAKEVGK